MTESVPVERLPLRPKNEPPQPMGTPRELLTFHTSEAYRYRLAVHDQLERALEAKDVLRSTTDAEAVAEKWRAVSETQFFFTAVRGVLQMAEAVAVVAEKVSPRLRTRVLQAKERFNREAPYAKEMRDILMHLDAYMAGVGLKQLPSPAHRVSLATPEDDFGLDVGGVGLSLKKTAAAAEQLAQDLIDAVKELEAEEGADSAGASPV